MRLAFFFEPPSRVARDCFNGVRWMQAPAGAVAMPDAQKGHLFLVTDRAQHQPSDAELVAAFVRDDPRAEAALFDRYYPLVRRVLCRSVGPTHEVDDLAQEVFLRLFRKLPTLRDPAALKGFALSIAMRVVQTELRGRWLRRWLRPSDDGVVPEQAGEDADLEARAALARFYALLDKLSPRHRAVFVLRQVDGLELTEVAAAAGVSLATVKRWLPRITRRVLAQAGRDPLLRAYVAPLGPEVANHG
jgi:RNA polymerase sigma-70 factor (ECF subfamily)